MSELPTGKRGLPLRIKMRHGPHFVDELNSRHALPVGKMVPLSAIQPNPGQPRSSLGDLGELVSSIRQKGVLEPILVRPAESELGDEPSQPTYRIISGERRYRAALEAGLYEVPVIEMEVSEEEALEIALIENLQRKDLTPFEEAEGYQALLKLHGYTHEQIANAVGRSRSSVTESLALLELTPRVRNAANALGVASKSTLLELLKIPKEEDRLRLLEQVAQRGLSRDDLRRQTRKGARDRARRRPYVFKFRSPDRTFSLALSFRQSEVDRADLIRALEQILGELRNPEESR